MSTEELRAALAVGWSLHEIEEELDRRDNDTAAFAAGRKVYQ